jgi:hypothetical protein
MNGLFHAIWAFGLLLPVLLAAVIWNLAKTATRWWLHLIVAPVIFLSEWCVGRLLFIVTGDNGSGPPGLGIALAPLFLSVAVALSGYLIALAYRGLKRLYSYGS